MDCRDQCFASDGVDTAESQTRASKWCHALALTRPHARSIEPPRRVIPLGRAPGERNKKGRKKKMSARCQVRSLAWLPCESQRVRAGATIFRRSAAQQLRCARNIVAFRRGKSEEVATPCRRAHARERVPSRHAWIERASGSVVQVELRWVGRCDLRHYRRYIPQS